VAYHCPSSPSGSFGGEIGWVVAVSNVKKLAQPPKIGERILTG